MYIAPRDMAILRSAEVYRLYGEYEAKFGEQFPYFNYADFRGSEKESAAQIYMNELQKAIEADTPYRIVSHRYDEFGH